MLLRVSARSIWLPGLVSCLAAAALAQADPRPSSQMEPPTIRVTTRIVILDVVVVDDQKKIVNRALTRDDFSITEDGVAQTVRSFEAPAAHRMPRDEEPVVTSAADLKKIGDAPVTVMVLDELNGRFEDMAFARQMMVKYLQAQPAILRQPTVLLIATNTRFLQVHDYTQNREELIDAVQKHMPEYPWRMMNSGPTGPGAVERMALVLAALQQIAQATNGTEGRKNIVWVGNGFPSANFVGLDSKEADLIQAAFRHVTAYLLAAHATVYTINPTLASTSTVDVAGPNELGLAVNENGGDPFGAGSVTFTDLAPFTGGYSFGGRNDLNHEIEQAVDAGQNYYTLSYAPSNRSDDSTEFRKIKVTMKDPRLRALTREGYYQVPAAELNAVVVDKDITARQVKRTLALDLTQAFNSALSYNGLDLAAQQGSAGSWQLHVKGNGIGWSDPDDQGVQHEEATIGAAWYDAKGKILGHVLHEEVAARASADGPADVFPLQLTVPAGAVRIRFVVRDARNGHIGTVDVTKF